MIQAKDVPDEDFAAAVRRGGLRPTGLTSIFAIAEDIGVPWKVVRAKTSSFIKRGLATGCACGCRGDVELTTFGDATYPLEATDE